MHNNDDADFFDTMAYEDRRFLSMINQLSKKQKNELKEYMAMLLEKQRAEENKEEEKQ